MGNTWITNVLHALDDDSHFAMPPGPARALAMNMGSIIEATVLIVRLHRKRPFPSHPVLLSFSDTRPGCAFEIQPDHPSAARPSKTSPAVPGCHGGVKVV